MTPAEHIRLLVGKLRELAVDEGVLERVAVHLLAQYQDPDNWGELASALRRARNYGAAEFVYKNALGVHGKSARLWNNYGILLRDWGKLGPALAAFEQAIALEPAYAMALVNKGVILERLHRFVDALSCYRAALASDPGNVVATNNTGVCRLALGDTAEAETWFEKTLQLDPDWADALFNLSVLKLDRGAVDAARPLVERLVRLLPDDAQARELENRLQASRIEPMKLELPRPHTLESHVSPALQKLCDELAGNPRSVFISYAWPDPATKRFAARLSKDLQSHSFQVVLDQERNLEVQEILTLLPHCQNIVILNDTHYVESGLLGKVPISKVTSVYPSFAFPLEETHSPAYLENVLKISAVAWAIAKECKDRGLAFDDMAFQVAQPDAFKHVPGLRLFVEGWRVDEIQMVFANLARFRSISVAYVGGSHCLAGYPLFDFSSDDYYAVSLASLVKVLDVGRHLTVDDAPIRFDRPDFSKYRWPESQLVSAKLWKIAKQDVAVWRPSITPSGEAAAVIQPFKDWHPL